MCVNLVEHSSIDREFKYLNLTQILYTYRYNNVNAYIYLFIYMYEHTITTVNYGEKKLKKS